MTNKEAVLKRYPTAVCTRDVDGFCWVREHGELRALNDARRETRSAAQAWKSASERIKAAQSNAQDPSIAKDRE